VALPLLPPWALEERLRREREVLGFYFSDHPLAPYRTLIETRATADTSRLRELRDGSEVTLVCIVAAMKPHTDRNQRPMAFVTIEDMKGTVETTVFADLFDRHRGVLKPGSVLEVRGRVNVREDAEPKMVLTAVQSLGSPADQSRRAVHIDLAASGGPASLEEIRELLGRYPGESPVYFTVRDGEASGETRIRAIRLLVQPSDDLLRALRERLGEGAVRVADGRPAAATL